MFEPTFEVQAADEQANIQSWFNEIYDRKGFGYLRPPEAYAIFTRLLDLKRGDALLDVGCGPGLMLEQAKLVGADAYGFDLSDRAIAMAQRYVPSAGTLLANAERLPYEDGSINAVTCLGVLERMIDLPHVFSELQRVGAPDARYAFLLRNSDTLLWKLFMEGLGMRNEASHQGANSLEGWADILTRNGFVVEQVLPDQWPPLRWRRLLGGGVWKPDPLKIRHDLLPMRFAHEFVFVLRKDEG